MRDSRRLAQRSYPLVATVAAALLLPQLPEAAPSAEPVYVPLGAALLIGAILTVRLRPGGTRASLLVVPAVVAFARFGLATVPALAFAQAVAEIVRGASILGSVVSASHSALAFALAYIAVQSLGLESLARLAAFAAAFELIRWSLWWLVHALGLSLRDSRSAERPDLVLSLVMAPLAVLPLLAWEWGGDGALIMALTASVTLLILVREAAHLVLARIEADAERDRLAHAKELQEEMLDLITHDARNPITAIMGYSQFSQQALQQNSTEQLPRYLAHIESSAAALRRLMDNLLRLSRIEHEADLSPPVPVEVGPLAREVTEVLRPLAEGKRQRLEIDVPRDLPPMLASPLLINEALTNLLSNAIKYTPENGQISVSARSGDESHTVRLCVTDTGIGISEADRARLFTRFFRSGDPRAYKERGSGLGLALTHSIVTRMGGRILVDSELNKGTTFCLVLPVAPISVARKGA